MPKNKEIKNIFTVNVVMGDKVYTSEAETVNDALGMIEPEHYKAYGIMVIESNGKSLQKRIPPFMLKRIFKNKDTRRIKSALFTKILR